MYTEVLRAIGGVEVYPVLSLILFVVVFAAVLIRTARLDRRELDQLARLPLDEGGSHLRTHSRAHPRPHRRPHQRQGAPRETHTR